MMLRPMPQQLTLVCAVTAVTDTAAASASQQFSIPSRICISFAIFVMQPSSVIDCPVAHLPQ